MGLVVNSKYVLIYSIILLAVIYWTIFLEELDLIDRLKDKYRQYQMEVPKFFSKGKSKGEYMTSKDELRELIKKEIIYKSVTLSSGKKSNYYIDGKMVTLSPKGANLSGKVFYDFIKDFDIAAIGGLTMGADPLVAVVSSYSFLQQHPIKAFIVRKGQKQHGRMKTIEGPVEKSDKVVLLDDVITTGASILEAYRAVIEFGCEVVMATCLVDREEGASEALGAEGLKFEPVFKISDLIGAKS